MTQTAVIDEAATGHLLDALIAEGSSLSSSDP